ncbi:MAG: polyhydroxyalkanoic acid system family protein [Bacteroidetes bacterium]|nr:polyhydroxyalkanoic acid system family protein [Bacteroidota bacterium]
MRIERTHTASQQEAIKKIDSFLDELMKRDFPGGVVVKEPTKSWNGNTMDFSFKVKKGFVSSKIEGTIQVEDGKIILNSDLPGLIKTFVSDEKISDVVSKQIDTLFVA